MPDTIPNLWPEQIKVAVQTPYAILKVQAGLLGKLTRGVLEGVVETEAVDDRVQHRLVVVAPAFNSYRHTLLAANHDSNLPYPVQVRAETFVAKWAYDDEEMMKLTGEVLNSPSTMAVILSLLAKSNEANDRASPASMGGQSGSHTGE